MERDRLSHLPGESAAIMDILTFLENLLRLPWMIACLAAIVVLVGWLLSGMFSRLLLRILKRFSILARFARLFRLPSPEPVSLWIRRIIRWVIFLLAVWWAWRILTANSEIVRFAESTWAFVLESLRLPAVAFFLDLAIIALATFLLIKVFGWVKMRFAELERVIEAERGKRLTAWKIQKLQLLSAHQITGILLVGSRYVRYAIDLLLGLVYLSGVFSIFPQTRGFVSEVINSISQILVMGWKGFVDYLPSLFSLIVIVVVAHFGLRFIHFIFREIERGSITLTGFHPEWAEPTFKLMRILLIVLAFILAFPYLPGSSSPTFQGISIFLGALLSLGSTSVIGNIVAGIVLIYAQAFRVGDRVKIADTVGDIIDKGLIATRVRTIKNVDITIPNGIVLANHIINYSAIAKEHGLILHTTVTIGYDAPWRLVHEALIRAALSTPDVLATPKPFVFQTSLDDSYVSYEINAYTREPLKMAVTYSNLHQNIQDKFNEANIEILSPHFGALRDGNASTIPADHRPADYRPPSFRVEIDKDE
jgi:small-conductance mechanosensitive channel